MFVCFWSFFLSSVFQWTERSKELKTFKHRDKYILLESGITKFSIIFWDNFSSFALPPGKTLNLQFRPDGGRPMVIAYWTVSHVSWKLSVSTEVRWRFTPERSSFLLELSARASPSFYPAFRRNNTQCFSIHDDNFPQMTDKLLDWQQKIS